MNFDQSALRNFAAEDVASIDDGKRIDFSSVGLYIAGIQVIFAILCASCCSVVAAWILPQASISAVRTVTFVTTLGLVLVNRPIRVGRVRGVNTVFSALRPSVLVYVLSLVIEQLAHTCKATKTTYETSTLGRVIVHAISLLMISSGLARAKNPRSESDVPFLVTASCLVLSAVIPTTPVAESGPLCEAVSLLDAGERVLRAFLFAIVYVVLVYAAAPTSSHSNELFVCVARATAASIWVLGSTTWLLPVAPLQAAVALFSRLGDSGDDDSEPMAYESLPLASPPPSVANEDVESEISDAEAIRNALRSTSQSAGGLSFAFGGACVKSNVANGETLE